MAATLTAKDIAKRIRRTNEALPVAVDRLRNWTKEGLIKPTGERHPGTGRKKRYAESAVIKAVLLQILSDATGGPVGRLAELADALMSALPMASKDEIFVLSRTHGTGGYGTGRFRFNAFKPSDLGQAISTSKADVHIVFNPHRILDLLHEEPQ